MRALLYAIIAVVALIGFLNLVSDDQPPRITYTADFEAPACPIAGACSNL